MTTFDAGDGVCLSERLSALLHSIFYGANGTKRGLSDKSSFVAPSLTAMLLWERVLYDLILRWHCGEI